VSAILLKSYATGLFAVHSAICVGSQHDCGKEGFMEITYTRVGDYLLPDITLQEKQPPDGGEPLGRYARMRRAFLKEHRTITYNTLLLSERLFPHLRDVDEIAYARRERGVAEEIILAELVYD